MLEAYWQLEAFTEVKGTLQALKDAGRKVAILSNGSTAMLQAAIDSAAIADLVDDTISVDRIGMFKARQEVYHMVLDDYAIDADAVSFQSSNRWDIAGAKAFGFHCIWVNRSDAPEEYPDLAPDRVVHDLTGLTA